VQGKSPVSSNQEFLKQTFKDKNFALKNGIIVSASPFRAVIRRLDIEQIDS
jgi:hypothetical protein